LGLTIYQYYQSDEGFQFSDSKSLVKPDRSPKVKERPIDKQVIELKRILTPVELNAIINDWKNSNDKELIKEAIRLVKAG
jgi:hypothetical protein